MDGPASNSLASHLFCLSQSWTLPPSRNGGDLAKHRNHQSPEQRLASLRRRLLDKADDSNPVPSASSRRGMPTLPLPWTGPLTRVP